MQKMPQTRRSGLIVKDVDGEVLIYDQESNKAHCLNESAARVWKYCDGKTTVAEATRSLSRDFNSPVDEKFVWFSVGQFSRDRLLEEGIEVPFLAGGMNRRQMVRALGLAAVIAVPLVTTIVAPTAAEAASQLAPGIPCCSNAQCQSTVCLSPPPTCTPPFTGTCL